MKIPASIRNLYDSMLPSYTALSIEVNKLMNTNKRVGWHYISRIKLPESFALKLETGRFSLSTIYHDFFACTLVVENYSAIEEAESLLKSFAIIKSKKPKDSDHTFKKPDTFCFDDSRIYASLKIDDRLPPPENNIYNLVFEIQIKTFLQHAWGIATHDLTYKTDSISWPKQRIAYEIKAMLEHAELSIAEAEKLSSSSVIAKIDPPTKNISNVINLLLKHWPKHVLPEDLVRLANSILSLTDLLKIQLGDLDGIVTRETGHGRGAKLKNLSPFSSTIQSIFNDSIDIIKTYNADTSTQKQKILLPSEVTLPLDFKPNPKKFLVV